ncbi:uncharacterized protein BO97DRAFT_404112 [Aspergillus homomorphus CBS 101889]|uniref:Uncharacterized protein n=1 Tax=Aspergillus homomorphus (strain CBS 101889) TaxID=1450537 RepID=A0A395I4S3_ASPHC|nr:hypothetical protein BO97DRAFT_404112 [Aspergillus homomorphus CBS 101889]RAL14583.1 hypothetical protein BO97DRAFT_404112 [Aspergillus homomorphus CBS 101889]
MISGNLFSIASSGFPELQPHRDQKFGTYARRFRESCQNNNEVVREGCTYCIARSMLGRRRMDQTTGHIMQGSESLPSIDSTAFILLGTVDDIAFSPESSRSSSSLYRHVCIPSVPIALAVAWASGEPWTPVFSKCHQSYASEHPRGSKIQVSGRHWMFRNDKTEAGIDT